MNRDKPFEDGVWLTMWQGNKKQQYTQSFHPMESTCQCTTACTGWPQHVQLENATITKTRHSTASRTAGIPMHCYTTVLDTWLSQTSTYPREASLFLWSFTGRLLQNLSLHFFYLLHFTEVVHLFGFVGVEGGKMSWGCDNIQQQFPCHLGQPRPICKVDTVCAVFSPVQTVVWLPMPWIFKVHTAV